MTTMATHDSNQPPSAERPKRRMVLRKIGSTSPLPPRAPSPSSVSLAPLPEPRRAPSMPAIASHPAPAPARRAPAPSAPSLPRASRMASTTMRPPPPPESDPNQAAPIPLTRLHTPRARFQSAMDLPPYRPGGPAEEGPLRESSSTTLPPLVASLPPPSPPLCLPQSAGASRAAHARVMAFWGSVAAATMVAILGGVVVGRHVARSNEEVPVHVLASGARAAEVARQAPPPETAATGVAEPALLGAGGVTIAATPVESLPLAPAVTVARPPRPPALAPIARPAAPPPLPAARAEVRVASSPVRAAEKDPTPSNGAEGNEAAPRAANAKTSVSAEATPPADPPAAEPPMDPLVKAVRADIEEEESRHK